MAREYLFLIPVSKVSDVVSEAAQGRKEEGKKQGTERRGGHDRISLSMEWCADYSLKPNELQRLP
jgi:hypothetical protein